MQAKRERRAHIRAHIKQHRGLAWKLLVIAVTGVVAALGMAGTAFAATASHAQYGPPPPPAVTPPGGFTAVVTTVTIGPAGGVVGPVTVDPASLSVNVPAGAFTKPMQVTVTEPDLAQITPMPGYYNVSGAGVIISYDGVKYTGTFAKPVTVNFTSNQIWPASKLLVWTGSAFDVAPGSMAGTGYAMTSFSHDPYYVVQSPTAVPRATVPVTGEPFVGEGLLAGLLVLAGAGGVVLSRRRVRA